jgi:hypothetical protein
MEFATGAGSSASPRASSHSGANVDRIRDAGRWCGERSTSRILRVGVRERGEGKTGAPVHLASCERETHLSIAASYRKKRFDRSKDNNSVSVVGCACTSGAGFASGCATDAHHDEGRRLLESGRRAWVFRSGTLGRGLVASPALRATPGRHAPAGRIRGPGQAPAVLRADEGVVRLGGRRLLPAVGARSGFRRGRWGRGFLVSCGHASCWRRG